jgi:hypothetical protein
MPAGTPTYRTVVLQDESLRSLQGFTQVPNVVLKHRDISFGAKVAFGVLLSYAWSEDFCFPAQDRLAKDLNCSVRQVQRLLTELKDHSFITWKQQGLNRPNIYYLLPINRWSRPNTKANTDTTDLSSPETTDTTSPDATDRSHQEATDSSPKEYSKKNIQKVVNRNDHRNPIRDRLSAGSTSSISDRALRSAYELSADQIGRVHWLVDRQVEILGSAGRNHAHYVKRAAEAVQAGDDALLDRTLGELNQAARTMAVASRPAYFHRMYTEAREKYRTAPLAPALDRRNELFRAPEANRDTDPRARIIADAEQRGFIIPDHIHNADLAIVNRWWANLIDGSRNP